MSNVAKIRVALQTARDLAKEHIEFVPVPVFTDQQRAAALALFEKHTQYVEGKTK